MRIVSGKYGGIRLTPVKSDKTRPTTDKVKESLFSMTGPYYNGGAFLDLFAGSGAVGIEAVSRGMTKAILVDKQFQAIKAIKENVEKIHAADQFDIIKGNAETVLKQLADNQQKFDMVFLDPPYKKQRIIATIDSLFELGLLNDDAIIICETDNQTDLPATHGMFEAIKQKNYGLTNLTIYRFGKE
ncbi:16S rRNA (guanine(966)-N(2))-methyltransferase RsmD [Lentilactobacillus sp. IMAU92037]|uniref:16S rRNA (guanine(966)-N(2))-methyltransferase RsmD n=1 Tax=Lentilactobacillus TaxID=2767893 RepID=UPI001C25E3A3|nr:MULTISPECIES: 16S rRNA (guanine(966)-N(2))-methyltransferase RsmD [Lentilactobacillus]MBU9788216.1 16S rRNA (guanine(966)-N(2))-methyltransferase RsmD [Lentilactobacillus dabitei]MBV0930671.1 16S rRNA (guanine(966)-N(2))-methyltransferase RsmD [Lentilactobacillus dabitei]MDM7517507.1 16S rRNA (guanine(966)-N(2))-methyltransferase RsmD [Lentilactobacillus sp. TOM.63]